MKLNSEQKIMLEGGKGPTKQKAMRLLIDLGRAANAEKLVPVVSAHVSGVSPLTGGDGLIKFLKDLGGEDEVKTAVDTCLLYTSPSPRD